MRKYFIAAVSSAVAVGLVTLSVPAGAQQKTEKQCREEWKAAGGRKATGKTEKDYVAGCHVPAAAAQPAAPGQPPAAAAPAKPATTAKPATPKSTATPKATGGREAMIARERACGKDWKADKAAGKIPQGMTWPKYWSECNTRKKAEGM
jgi:hypothetical protein